MLKNRSLTNKGKKYVDPVRILFQLLLIFTHQKQSKFCLVNQIHTVSNLETVNIYGRLLYPNAIFFSLITNFKVKNKKKLSLGTYRCRPISIASAIIIIKIIERQEIKDQTTNKK